VNKAFIALAALAAAAVFASAAFASTVVVGPGDATWGPSDTRGAGAAAFTTAYGAPAGLGFSALELSTSADPADKADYWTAFSTPAGFGDISNVSYWTYQASGSFAGADAALELAVDVNGGTLQPGDFTTLVFEPYQNGTVVPGTWQQWNARSGGWWSTRTAGTLHAGGGGAPFYTLADVWAGNPDATVLAIGVNVGTNNPSYTVATDGVMFNDTTWDFEGPPPPPTVPQTKADCKHGGWQDFGFRNQGQCVSFVATHGKHGS